MRGLPSSALLPPLLALAIISWNVVISGWVSARREAPRLFTGVTAVCGLLIAPVLVVAVASGTEAGSRTIFGITWLVPAVVTLFVVQVLLAMALRIVSPVIAIPILLYDIAVAMSSVADYLVTVRGSAPQLLQAMVASRDVVIGFAAGRAALVSPFAVLVPMIVPAYHARWRLTGVVRALLVLAATAMATVLFIEWPRGIGAIRSYDRAQTTPQARPAGDFAVGMRLFPSLSGPPPATTSAADLVLADSIAPEIVLLLIEEDAVRGTALDSLSRILEPLRQDSIRIAVALVNRRIPAAPGGTARDLVIERILQRVRPDVFFPAFAAPLPGAVPSRAPDIYWWQAAITNGAKVVERVRPRTRVGWAMSRFDEADSALYVWAMAQNSPVDIVGMVAFPSFSGLPGLDARLRAVDRWRARTLADSALSRPHWIAVAGGLPHAHGEASQGAAILHTAAWATRRPWVTAIIVGEPGDYDNQAGLRAADGRLRPAARNAARLSRVMREARASLGR